MHRMSTVRGIQKHMLPHYLAGYYGRETCMFKCQQNKHNKYMNDDRLLSFRCTSHANNSTDMSTINVFIAMKYTWDAGSEAQVGVTLIFIYHHNSNCTCLNRDGKLTFYNFIYTVYVFCM